MMPQTHATTPNAASAAPTQRIAPADVTNAMMPRVTSTAAATVRTTANGNRSAPTIAIIDERRGGQQREQRGDSLARRGRAGHDLP